jgi:PAS domain-containing protein
MLLVNEDFLELLGRTRKDVVGRSWEEWMTGEDVAAAATHYDGLVLARKPYFTYTRVVRTDRKKIIIAARCTLIKGRSTEEDLVMAEMLPVEEDEVLPTLERIESAKFVQDLTYELAARTGRDHLGLLTQALIETSSAAEHTLELLTGAFETLVRING